MRSEYGPIEDQKIRCRVAACLESLGDGKEWSFYLINDSVIPFDVVLLKVFGHEWGDFGQTTYPDVKITDVTPGAHALIWRDNDDELRMWLTLQVQVSDREVELLVEFPLLYRSKDNLPSVTGLARSGWAVSVIEGGD